MKLMFNKTTLDGKWFWDKEMPVDNLHYTEKVPPDTAHAWDEDKGEWSLPDLGAKEAQHP